LLGLREAIEWTKNMNVLFVIRNYLILFI
jgi:hypothetical protein